MKTTLWLSSLLTISAIGLAGCAADEPSSGLTDDNVIRFTAAADYARAGDITTNNLTEFNVYAYVDKGAATADPQPYMDNVTVTKTGTNSWTYSPVAYWPAKEAVDFYAYAPSDWVGDQSPLKAIPWDNNMTDRLQASTDLVYAVAPNLTGAPGQPNAQVIFNFRHALSKVTVRMSSSNTDLTVKVSTVMLAGLRSKGNFYFPGESTAGVPSTSNVGTWAGLNTVIPVVLHLSQNEAGMITLTTTPTDMGDTGMGIGGSKYMIPQLLTWRSNGFGNDTYIMVMCSVYDADTGVKLWPNENTPSDNVVEGSTFGDGLLKFPLSTSNFSEWRPGYHYIYNLVINSNEEMGEINFGTPTVDTFVNVETSYE